VFSFFPTAAIHVRVWLIIVIEGFFLSLRANEHTFAKFPSVLVTRRF
jgi:hypothetical protein